jgi:hypothetical protein
MAIMLDYGGCKKVNMQRKMGVKGENEVALFVQRYCKPELFSCARERKTTTVYSENQSADQQSSISDMF